MGLARHVQPWQLDLLVHTVIAELIQSCGSAKHFWQGDQARYECCCCLEAVGEVISPVQAVIALHLPA